MVVEKSGPRSGQTLAHGVFDARETIHVCVARCCWPSGPLVTRRAASLSEALMPGSNFGYDVMVFVGLGRFLDRRQREELQAALRFEHGVTISTGEVSELEQRFATYFARLHRHRADKIKAALEADGGWPLHVDATGEAGRGTQLVAMAGWRQWVLGAWKIATEREELILPCLREVCRCFGAPSAMMRDLGKAMIPALDALVAELEAPIPVLACHQHFVADLCEDPLDPVHGELRHLFRRAKVRPKLRALVRDLGRKLGANIEQAREAVRDWQALEHDDYRIEDGPKGIAVVRSLAQWILDFKAQATGLDFPFDRPYLDLYDRCLTALRATDTFLQNAPNDKCVKRLLERLHRYLEPVDGQVPFGQVATRLRRRAALVDERRRSGRKNLGQDLEHLRAEAALVRNLEHDDYTRIVCGSLDQLPALFAELDKLERQKRLNGEPIEDQEDNLKTILQLASASLSPADSRIVRDEKMNQRIEAAARSRAPKRRYGPHVKSNPTGS
jgi:hypothetical protein